ncbi:7-cyano-7-deazaguanine synthase QueC [Methanosarcinales archaeon]|nr:MAG: 7-cyano-7-deazaguanine synthase QueC [Methanosarcinales archaeon]
MSDAVVLLSSGLDSVVALKMALDEFDDILCLTFDYGQRAREREIECSEKIASSYDLAHEVIELSWLKNFWGALTDGSPLPEMNKDRLNDASLTCETAKTVWVPARNLVFIAIAASFAENRNYDVIVTGFNREEALTFPDNSPEFIESFNELLKHATLSHPRVYAPLGNLDKVEIVRRGMAIGAPFELSWSCYNAETLPCGVCESCVRRKRAFDLAGFTDPTKVL